MIRRIEKADKEIYMLDELNVTYLVLICKQEFCNYLFCKYAQTYNGCISCMWNDTYNMAKSDSIYLCKNIEPHSTKRAEGYIFIFYNT